MPAAVTVDLRDPRSNAQRDPGGKSRGSQEKNVDDMLLAHEDGDHQIDRRRSGRVGCRDESTGGKPNQDGQVDRQDEGEKSSVDGEEGPAKVPNPTAADLVG